jgi:hypothetical protein
MIKSLKECKSIQEAEPLLKNASHSLRKVVETAFQLMNHPNPQQQEFGRGFLSTAMREMDDGEQPDQPHDKGVKSKGDKFVKEEELAGGNPSGTQGSEQSSKNSEPVTSKEGTDEPEGDMAQPGMSTENQFAEAFPPQMPGQMPPPPMPPQQPQMPGMDPNVAQQMAPPQQMPPMNTPQQIQQMQYTVKKMVEPIVKEIVTLRKFVKFQQEAIKALNGKLQESISMKNGLDLNSLERAIPKGIGGIQETGPTINNVTQIPGAPQGQVVPQIYQKSVDLANARQSIVELDRMINTSKQSKQPYQ